MSTRKVKAIVVGAGSAGTQVIKSLHARGVEIVGALELTHLGADIGEHIGIGPLGVTFENDPQVLLNRVTADVAVVAVATELGSSFPIVKPILEHRVNVVTIAEDAFYPWTDADKKIAAEIDAIARANDVTFFATGMQDLFWQGGATLFSSGVRELHAIRIISKNVLDGASPEILDTIWVGKTLDEFHAREPSELKEVSTGPLSAIALALGLTTTDTSTVVEPIRAKRHLYSQASDVHVPSGRIIGTREITTVHTQEGIILSNEFQAKLGEQEGEADGISLLVEGEPNLGFTVRELSGFENTAAVAVNRIPDVLAAPAGYLTVKDLPRPAWRPDRSFEITDED